MTTRMKNRMMSGRKSLWMAVAVLMAMTSSLSAQIQSQGSKQIAPAETSVASSDANPVGGLAGPVASGTQHLVVPASGYCGGAIDPARRQHDIVVRLRVAWIAVLLRSGLHLQPGLTVAVLAGTATLGSSGMTLY